MKRILVGGFLVLTAAITTEAQDYSKPVGFSSDGYADFQRHMEMSKAGRSVASKLEQGKFEATIAAAEEFVSRYPEEAAHVSYVLFVQANALLALDRQADALAKVSEAIKKNADAVWAYSLRGRIHGHQKNYSKALDDFGRAIKIAERINALERKPDEALSRRFNPFDEMSLAFRDFRVDGYLGRAQVLLEQGKSSAALADARKLLEISASDQAVDLLARSLPPDKLVPELTRLIDEKQRNASDPGEGIDVVKFLLYRRAQVHAEAGKFDLALQDITPIVERLSVTLRGKKTGSGNTQEMEGQLASALMFRGKVFAGSQRPDEALADFDRIAGLRSSLEWEARYNVARINLDQERFEETIVVLTSLMSAVETGGGPPELKAELHRLRARAHAEMSRFDPALADLEIAVGLGGQLVDTYTLRAAVYRAQGKAADAAADEQRIVELGGSVPGPTN